MKHERRVGAGLPTWLIFSFAALLFFALSFELGGPPLLEDPNEGQYAEVGREMLESGNWWSPHLDQVLFLNKPPLQYWLVATSYAWLGVGETAARLPGVLVTALTVILVFFLGRLLFDPATGALAAMAYAAMPSTVLEARLVRPDTILTAAVVGALCAFAAMVRSTEARRRGPLIALQLALAAGVMAKGPIAVLLAGLPIAAVIILQHRWDLARTLSNWRSWLIFAALAVPWHAVVAILHDGFAWDYVVHQHFLRLIDQKLPRDSVPIPLTTFWAAFLGRTFPWTLFLPLALVFTWMRRHSQGWSSQLLLAWLTGTLLFFSLSSSRLEHYTLPAVPAVALLVAALFRNAAGPASKWTAPTRITLFIFGIGSLIGAVGAPALLRELDALRDLSGLGDIAGYYFAATAAGCAAAFVASRRLPFLPVPILAACLLLLTPLVVRSITIVARRHSSAPVAAELRRQADLSAAAVVFEAPIEYQHVAGLCFYLQRRIRLLRPEGFVPPAYLQPHVGELFINPGELQQMWRERPVFLVTNPLEPMPRTVELSLPTPLHHIADVANRSIYANRPPAETIGYGEMFD